MQCSTESRPVVESALRTNRLLYTIGTIYVFLYDMPLNVINGKVALRAGRFQVKEHLADGLVEKLRRSEEVIDTILD